MTKHALAICHGKKHKKLHTYHNIDISKKFEYVDNSSITEPDHTINVSELGNTFYKRKFKYIIFVYCPIFIFFDGPLKKNGIINNNLDYTKTYKLKNDLLQIIEPNGIIQFNNFQEGGFLTQNMIDNIIKIFSEDFIVKDRKCLVKTPNCTTTCLTLLLGGNNHYYLMMADREEKMLK
jgi:hypothetical protein